MRLLAIDCSTQACSVALCVHGKIFLRHEILPQYHAKKILFLIDELFKHADATVVPRLVRGIHPLPNGSRGQAAGRRPDAIAVGIGPGSFTGLRIAASVAQGLAFGWNIPLVPVSSLQIIAQTAYEKYADPAVLVAMDARMGEVYWGEYEWDPVNKIMITKKADCLTKPKKCLSTLPFAVGSAFEVYNLPFYPSKIDKILLPQADALITIAIESMKKKRMILPNQLQLNYLRNEVVHKS